MGHKYLLYCAVGHVLATVGLTEFPLPLTCNVSHYFNCVIFLEGLKG